MNTYQIDHLKNKTEGVRKFAAEILGVANAHDTDARRKGISVEKTYDIAALEYFHDKLLLMADYASEALDMVDSLRHSEIAKFKKDKKDR